MDHKVASILRGVGNHIRIYQPIPFHATSNSSHGYKYSASSTLSGTQPYYAFQEDNNEWVSDRRGASSWIMVELPSPCKVWKLELRGRIGTQGENFDEVLLRGSHDKSDWTTLLSVSENIDGSAIREFEIPPYTTAFRNYSLYFPNSQGKQLGLSLIRLYAIGDIV